MVPYRKSGLPSALRIYLALEPVDMRKQYDGRCNPSSLQLAKSANAREPCRENPLRS